VAVERGRNPPDAAASVSQLQLLDGAVFDEAVGRIGDHRLDAVLPPLRQPCEAVGADEPRGPKLIAFLVRRARVIGAARLGELVETVLDTLEESIDVQPQVRTYGGWRDLGVQSLRDGAMDLLHGCRRPAVAEVLDDGVPHPARRLLFRRTLPFLCRIGYQEY
jgi:hypothetical protein